MAKAMSMTHPPMLKAMIVVRRLLEATVGFELLRHYLAERSTVYHEDRKEAIQQAKEDYVFTAMKIIEEAEVTVTFHYYYYSIEPTFHCTMYYQAAFTTVIFLPLPKFG